MNRRSKILTFLSLSFVVALIVVYMIFAPKTTCKDMQIDITNDSIINLVDEKDIKDIILNEYHDLIGKHIEIVDLAGLETKIESYPSIKKADVFKRHGGVLSVNIIQRVPIIRVMPMHGENFFIDHDGSLMPVSKIGSARVPVANGVIKFKYRKDILSIENDSLISRTIIDLYEISKYISEDAFLKAQIEQIYVKKNGEFELVPKVGKHIVLLGEKDNYEKKLSYLKHFYLNVIKNEGWRTYSYINLKFKNQIVCTRTNS